MPGTAERSKLSMERITADPTLTASLRDLRSEARVSHVTVGLILPAEDAVEVSRIQKCWTRDISPSGARLICEQPIDPDRLILQLMLPRMEDRLIQAQIVSRRMETNVTLDGCKEIHVYGVRFVGVLS
jgi:hypothetical protein